MALLNGKFVKPEEIDPAKHKFIGLFRSPKPPDTRFFDEETKTYKYADVMSCSCGHNLWTRESIQDHWRKGHFDVPQYVNIEPDKTSVEKEITISELTKVEIPK